VSPAKGAAVLEELSVRNYALIDSLVLSPGGALNIITGETGAGKSIIIGSLSFLLGGKADTDCIRSGANETVVSAVISIKENDGEVRSWLESRDIKLDEGGIVIRRSFKSNGRSSMYIQDVPVSRNEAAGFLSLLFDIHGQHEHESLLRRETHRKYLDRFAGIEAEVLDFNGIFQRLSENRQILENLTTNERERLEKIDLLRFQVDEIEKAALKTGEARQLETELSRLSSFEKLAGLIENASLAIFEDSSSALGLLRKTKTALESAASLDESLKTLSQRANELFFEAEDIGAELRAYREKLSFEPTRLEDVQERIALIQKLKKKYTKHEASGAAAAGASVEDAILHAKGEAETEIEALSAGEETQEKLRDEISALERDIARRARELTAKRKQASAILSTKVSEILSELGMAEALFSVRLEAKEREGQSEATIVCGPFGADDIEFLISANRGEPLKELSRIASGGELSRVMLAIKTVLAIAGMGSGGNDNSPDTLVFDEIDAGIGGEVAIAVGEYLSKIGRKKQIFCITHLASIAARAANHLFVEKRTDAARTVTTVRTLSEEERRSEIARMLSGERGETALRHADELLKKYGH
jgi:DNA repair protein RecN (Recombination protein N)